jgi:hypothetical protein
VNEAQREQRPGIVDERIEEGRRRKNSAPSTIMRFLPSTSESAPAGSLKNTPVTVEAAKMMPINSGMAPRSAAKPGSTGLRAIW